MKTGTILIIAAVGVAAYFLFKNQTTTEQDLNPTTSGGGGMFPMPPTPAPAPVPKPLPVVVTPDRTGYPSVRTASRHTLDKFEQTAKANPSKTIWYPEYGIVLSGGQGFSTQYPSSYVTQNTSTNPSSSQSTIKNTLNYGITNPYANL